jgi:hypothetical protein
MSGNLLAWGTPINIETGEKITSAGSGKPMRWQDWRTVVSTSTQYCSESFDFGCLSRTIGVTVAQRFAGW